MGFAKSVSGASYLLPTLLGDAIREGIAALIDPIPEDDSGDAPDL